MAKPESDAHGRQHRSVEISAANDEPYRLSDGSEHPSKAEADAYKAVNYADEQEHATNISVDKLIAGGTAATLGLAGIYLAVRHRRKKD